MTRKLAVLLAVLVGVVGGACDPPDGPKAPIAKDRLDADELKLISLVNEDSCPELLSWLHREAAAHQDRWHGVFHGQPVPVAMPSMAGDARDSATSEMRTSSAEAAGAAPPQAGVDYSTTNVQEEGVDEPDLVKTDGNRLVTLAGNHLRIVDVSGDKPRLRASLPLDSAASELLLSRDRVLVVGSDQPQYRTMDSRATGAADIAVSPGFTASRTKVTVVDISSMDAPKVVSTLMLDGSYVAARMTGGVARLVLRSSPEAINRDPASLAQTTIDDWLPKYEYADVTDPSASTKGRVVACEAVRHPPEFVGAGLVNVVSIDPEDPRPGNGASVVGAGEHVYASEDNLYVTSGDWQKPATHLHMFDITDAVTTKYVASGKVDGRLLNSFSMSEFDGVLRVATTTQDTTNGATESQVVTLRRDGEGLSQLGRVGGLGKGEQIYAVRFLGEKGYVVTFRQTDPLYVVDLSEPDAPAVKGELKINGYSAYLHPIADDRLIGIGQDATDEGRRLGAQASLFDVSDPASPKRLAAHSLGSWISSAEYDHHAFLWWPAKKLAVVPVEGAVVAEPACPPNARCAPAPSSARSSAIALTITSDKIEQKGTVSHPTGMPVTRSLVVRDRLITLSESGLFASPLDDVVKGDWLAF